MPAVIVVQQPTVEAEYNPNTFMYYIVKNSNVMYGYGCYFGDCMPTYMPIILVLIVNDF